MNVKGVNTIEDWYNEINPSCVNIATINNEIVGLIQINKRAQSEQEAYKNVFKINKTNNIFFKLFHNH